MAQADSNHSTRLPIDSSRRRFMTVAAAASAVEAALAEECRKAATRIGLHLIGHCRSCYLLATRDHLSGRARHASTANCSEIQSSVAKYMVKRRGPPSQGWRTFLRNHAADIAA